MNHKLTLIACLAALVVAGCSGETKLPSPTGKGNVMAINAISTSPSIAFLIEERSIASVNYKNASTITEYDDLDYTFNFEALLPPDPADTGANQPTRIASQHLDVIKDTTYIFVLSGSLAAPTLTLWESPEPVFVDGATNFEVSFGHLASTMGDFDVYFDDPAVAPVLGNEIGTLTFGEVLAATSFEAGDYKLTLTAVGDPGSVLFESDTLAPTASTSLLFNTFDTDANDLAPVAVRGVNLTSSANFTVADIGFPSTVRFIHANSDIGPVDIYVEDPIDDPMILPLVENQVFGDISADLPMPEDPVPFTYTEAGNIGVIHIDTDRSLGGATRNDYFLIQNSSGVDVLVTDTPDRRSIETLIKMSIVNTAAIDVSLDVYVVPRDELIDEANPLLAAVPVGLAPVSFTLAEGGYDLYVTANGDKVPMAGPIPLDVVLGDVTELAIYENVADPTMVDVTDITPP